jgi:hypothetical protein
MTPMHWSPNCAARIILVKQMVFIVEIHHTVRIVHPFFLWRKMNQRSMRFIVSNASCIAFHRTATGKKKNDYDKTYDP